MNSVLGSGLLIRDEIQIQTDYGKRYIQLLLGDITRLPPEKKMDVVMVSAVQGHYIPVPVTLIGSLHLNLNLDLYHLAKDKEGEVRKQFSCWWSKPLPEHLPFRRLFCVEPPRFADHLRHPVEWADDVFQSLVHTFENRANTVITPLLATGVQGCPKIVMLRAMLDSAIKRMRQGLQLRVLRIVLYTPDISWASQEDREVIACFENYKRTVEAEGAAVKRNPKVSKQVQKNRKHRQRSESPLKLVRTHPPRNHNSVREMNRNWEDSGKLVQKVECNVIATSAFFRRKRQIWRKRLDDNNAHENDTSNASVIQQDIESHTCKTYLSHGPQIRRSTCAMIFKICVVAAVMVAIVTWIY